MPREFKVNEEFVIGCLINYNYRLQEIQSELIKSYENIMSKNDLIETLQVKVHLDSIGSGKTNSHKDLNDVIENVEKRQQKYITELLKSIEQLELKEDAIRRVWICYKALPFLEKDILTRLYIGGIKWDAVLLDMNLSKGTLVKKRTWAIKQIIKLYESDCSNADIIRMGNENLLHYRKKKIDTTKSDQINIFDLLN